MSHQHLDRKTVLNIVYTQQAYRMADAYARLKAEVEQLTLASQGAVKYVDHTMALTRQSMEHHKQVSRIEAQVERLTKAGDDLAWLAHFHYGHGKISEDKHSASILDAWEAAKEDKTHE